MPKRNPQSKPAHQPARRKTKPKFDVPADVGEPSTASWVYRDEPSTMVAETPMATAASTISETIAAPISAVIHAAAAVAPEPTPDVPAEAPPVSARFGEPLRIEPREEGWNPFSSALSLFGMGLGVMQFFASTTVKLVTAPFGIARRLMPD